MFSRLSSGLLLLAALIAAFAFVGISNSEEAPQGLRPMVDSEPAELATMMGELQRLTHKMALATDAENPALAAFYMHESIAQLEAIQRDSPEYEGQPVALLVDRIALPAYQTFGKSLATRPVDRERMLDALDGVIGSCNRCHESTGHGIIRITRGTEVNPFNQSFEP